MQRHPLSVPNQEKPAIFNFPFMKGSLSLLKCSRSYWLPLDRHLSQSEIIARDKRRITCRRDSCRTSLVKYKLNTMSSLLFVKHSFSYIQLERKMEGTTSSTSYHKSFFSLLKILKLLSYRYKRESWFFLFLLLL